MGVVLMQGNKLVCYNFEMIYYGVLNYHIYDKELYTLVQDVMMYKNYLMGKETIIDTHHQNLHYL